MSSKKNEIKAIEQNNKSKVVVPRKFRKARKYDPSFCERIVELGKEGYSVVQIADEFGVNRDTIYQWRNDTERFPGFKEAFDEARVGAESYWEKVGQDGIMGKIKGFNQVSWIFMMKARFQDWHEKTKSEVEITNKNATLSDDELERKIALIKERILESKDEAQG